MKFMGGIKETAGVGREIFFFTGVSKRGPVFFLVSENAAQLIGQIQPKPVKNDKKKIFYIVKFYNLDIYFIR
jgi:hypothetical protein